MSDMATPAELRADRDPADYGPADDLGADPATTVCRACGRIAVEHTQGRYSIYGVCPIPTTAAQTCPQCLHGWHGRRVCRDANCCSCRLTWRDAWKAGYMQGWRDYPSALWRGFYPPTEVEMESTVAAEGYTDTYPVDNNGWAAVSRPFIRIRADEVEQGDLLILDSGLSRVTWVTPYTLGNGVTVVHIAGPTNVVRATHETVTVLRWHVTKTADEFGGKGVRLD